MNSVCYRIMIDFLEYKRSTLSIVSILSWLLCEILIRSTLLWRLRLQWTIPCTKWTLILFKETAFLHCISNPLTDFLLHPSLHLEDLFCSVLFTFLIILASTAELIDASWCFILTANMYYIFGRSVDGVTPAVSQPPTFEKKCHYISFHLRVPNPIR